MAVPKLGKTIAVAASAALILGALGAPADAKKKKKKPRCAPYASTTYGADVETATLTDANTAEAPLELTVSTTYGVGTSSPDPPAADDTATHAFIPVQVDSALPESGFYATLEHTPGLDYDLYVRDDTGLGLAYSAGFAPGVPMLDGTGNGGETGVGSENVIGLRTPDCQGYVVDVISATSPGGDVTLKLWLGEATYP